MTNPIGRYRPPYPTREELLGLSTRKPSDPPAVQIKTVSKPSGQDSQQSQRDSPPAPPQKDYAQHLPRKDTLFPTRWDENESSATASEAVDARKDSTVAWSNSSSLVEEIRQRRSEKRLKPVGPSNLSLGGVDSTAAASGNTSPKAVAERPLPALPPQPALQLPPRNANLPGRQVKPLGEPLPAPPTDAMGSSKSKPARSEISAPLPRRPLQNNTLLRSTQLSSEKTCPAPETSGRKDLPLKLEGAAVRPAELRQNVPKPKSPPSPTNDIRPPTTKALPEPKTTAAEARADPFHGDQRSQLVEPRLLSSPMPPSKTAKGYSAAIFDLNSSQPVEPRLLSSPVPPSKTNRSYSSVISDLNSSQPVEPRLLSSPMPPSKTAESYSAAISDLNFSQPVEPRPSPSPMPPPKTAESYSAAISDLSSSVGRSPQNLHENGNLSRIKVPEGCENDKLCTTPSPSNYTDNSASISSVGDSNASISPPSSYPDEDDRPLTPLNASPANKGIIWNLNTVQYHCYVEHRNMKLSKNERHPMPCMLCNVTDQEPRRKCTWCCLRICKGCHWLLTEKCGRSMQNLVDMLAKEGKTGVEVMDKMEAALKAEIAI